MAEQRPYNPLDKKNLGVSVAEALVTQEPISLDEIKSRGAGKIKPFYGAGIYAIYYKGSFPSYHTVAVGNADALSAPIYVGKAIPEGARKGTVAINPEPGQALYLRLREHAESIRQVYRYAKEQDRPDELKPEDFLCRYLLVDDVWIPLGESMMIEQFRPIWNVVIDGFGNHDPGGGRYKQQRSAWDTLHPGRRWAFKCEIYAKTTEQIVEELNSHFASLYKTSS